MPRQLINNTTLHQMLCLVSLTTWNYAMLQLFTICVSHFLANKGQIECLDAIED